MVAVRWWRCGVRARTGRVRGSCCGGGCSVRRR